MRAKRATVAERRVERGQDNRVERRPVGRRPVVPEHEAPTFDQRPGERQVTVGIIQAGVVAGVGLAANVRADSIAPRGKAFRVAHLTDMQAFRYNMIGSFFNQTLPSSIGTLKSTRTRARLPARSASSRVRKAMWGLDQLRHGQRGVGHPR